MKILGRPLSRYIINFGKIHEYLWDFARCILLFKRPHRVVWAYVTKVPPASRLVELRNGLKIVLSNDPNDIVSLFGVFVREDYGRVPAGVVVLDIGANIGMFALYAAQRDAAVVHAYEPSAESFEYLERNIALNGLQRRVIPHRLAVADAGDRMVRFPRRSNVFNAILTDDAADVAYDLVPATSLAHIVGEVGPVDLVKLDCEGAEYTILMACRGDVLQQIRSISLEYHQGRKDAILRHLTAHGFVPSWIWMSNQVGGIIRLTRREPWARADSWTGPDRHPARSERRTG